MPMHLEPAAYMEWAKRFQHTRPLDVTNSGMPPPDDLVKVPLADPGRGPYGPPDLIAGVGERWGVPADHVLLGIGASAANFVAVGLCAEPGAEVLVEEPSYEPLVRIPQVFGATLTRFPRNEDEAWRCDPERVAAACTDRTRLICVTNPHNPSGVRMTDGELQALAAIAESRDAWVLVDEVYLDYTADTPQRVAAALHPRLISTSSLTKVYGLGEIRVGWACMAPELVRQGEILTDLMNVNLPGPALRVAQQAWPHLDALQARAQDWSAAGRALLEPWLAAHGCSWVPSAGCPFGWVKLPDGVTGTALFDATAEAGAMATPGVNFDGMDEHVRIGWTIPPDQFALALDAIGAAIDRLRS